MGLLLYLLQDAQQYQYHLEIEIHDLHLEYSNNKLD